MDFQAPEENEAWLLSYADLVTTLLVFFVMLLSAAEISQAKMQKIQQSLSGARSSTSLSTMQSEVEARIKKEGLQDLVSTDLTDQGLELRLNSGLIFDSAEAVIRPELEPTMDRMLQTLVPYSKHYQFAVEGHTDARPLLPGAKFRSNWELSAERANAVRSRLDSVGIEPKRIRVEGYADTRGLPEKELKGLSEVERLARHRRVVVRVY